MHYYKYHGLGNDYLVLEPSELSGEPLTGEHIRRICDRHYGLGSDGILLGPIMPDQPEFSLIGALAKIPEESNAKSFCALRILNPDGSEAEKSGNGLRIFSRYLYDRKLVGNQPFYLTTLGGQVCSQVLNPEENITVDMGHITFHSSAIPSTGPDREILQETWHVGDKDFILNAANIGNPHCIVLCPDGISRQLAEKYGPLLECDPRFPQKANVQFLQVRSPHSIAIEIWERGAGYTLASGSSASACAATAIKLGLCQSPVTVNMPGGKLEVSATTDFQIRQSGPVTYVFQADSDI